MFKREYSTKINVEGDYAYKQINSFVDKISAKKDISRGGVTYFLDNSFEGVVRLNRYKCSVELTDKVEEWVFNSINELNKKQ